MKKSLLALMLLAGAATVSAQTVVQVGSLEDASTTNKYPMYSFYECSSSEIVYSAEDLEDLPAGTLSKLEFAVTGGQYNYSHFRVFLENTTDDQVVGAATQGAIRDFNEMTLVYDSADKGWYADERPMDDYVGGTVASPKYLDFEFDTDFEYTGGGLRIRFDAVGFNYCSTEFKFVVDNVKANESDKKNCSSQFDFSESGMRTRNAVAERSFPVVLFTVTPKVDAPKVYLRGDFNGWGTTHEFVAGSEDGVYTVSLDELSGSFKVATEDWSTVNLGGNEGDVLAVGTPYSLVENGANLALGSTVKNAVVTYNAKEKTVTVTGDEVLTYYMKHPWGTGEDADWSWKELTDNGDGSYSVVAAYGGTGVNVNTAASDAGAMWFGDPFVFDPSEAQSTIHLSSVEIGDECTFTYWKDNNYVEVVKSVPTGVNDLNVKANKVYKVIENGQVVIVKDNARYNVAGQMLR